MINENYLLLNVVIRYTERYLVSGVAVKSLSEIYNPDFLLNKSPDNLGKESRQLSKEINIDFVQSCNGKNPDFLYIDGHLVQVSSISSIFIPDNSDIGYLYTENGEYIYISIEEIKELLKKITLSGLTPDWKFALEKRLAEMELNQNF